MITSCSAPRGNAAPPSALSWAAWPPRRRRGDRHTDDDPPREDPSRSASRWPRVPRGRGRGGPRLKVLVIEPRATAIRTAVRMARPRRRRGQQGHETRAGRRRRGRPLRDDRVELREALAALQTHSEEQKSSPSPPPGSRRP
ncbi:hypothetical protein QJS66_05575 [Kocuria rhizophila]|nr:hypothetical protein QJS66_05575 [Kocuria rhizophila]